jgi:hypothetical protein
MMTGGLCLRLGVGCGGRVESGVVGPLCPSVLEWEICVRWIVDWRCCVWEWCREVELLCCELPESWVIRIELVR